MTILIVDIETPIYRICVRNETAMPINGEIKYSTNLPELYRQVNKYIEDLVTKLKGTEVICVFGGKNNFRKQVLPEYKANRKAMRKPTGLGQLHKYVKTHYRCIIHPNMEADDSAGILATSEDRIIKGDRVVISIDKDMKQIPSHLYNSDKDEYSKIPIAAADYYFYQQILIGDTTDNYKGCPGIGPLKANKAITFLGTEKDNWKSIVKLFNLAGKTEADALVQARCARLLRASDYDFNNKQVILWTPKK